MSVIIAGVDPRQRSADRRRFVKIAVLIAVGLGFIGFSVLMLVLGMDPEDTPPGRGFPPADGILLGSVLIAVAVFDLVRRLVTGPTKPGKRARF